jgi:hypothetical protein
MRHGYVGFFVCPTMGHLGRCSTLVQSNRDTEELKTTLAVISMVLLDYLECQAPILRHCSQLACKLVPLQGI